MNGSGYVAFLFLYQIGNMTFSLALSNIFLLLLIRLFFFSSDYSRISQVQDCWYEIFYRPDALSVIPATVTIITSLCGRDGRTICGPQCVPKSTSVTLAVDEKTLPMATITGQTDGQTECDAICGPS